MHCSKSAGYAIHALSCIGAAAYPCLVRDVARCTGLHKPYLAKIINQLARQGLVKAKRGYHGGVVLARPPEKISLFQVMQAVDRDNQRSSCFFGLEKCPMKGRCPAHKPWKKMRQQLEAMLRKTTLNAVIAAIPPGKRLCRQGPDK